MRYHNQRQTFAFRYPEFLLFWLLEFKNRLWSVSKLKIWPIGSIRPFETKELFLFSILLSMLELNFSIDNKLIGGLRISIGFVWNWYDYLRMKLDKRLPNCLSFKHVRNNKIQISVVWQISSLQTSQQTHKNWNQHLLYASHRCNNGSYFPMYYIKSQFVGGIITVYWKNKFIKKTISSHLILIHVSFGMLEKKDTIFYNDLIWLYRPAILSDEMMAIQFFSFWIWST